MTVFALIGAKALYLLFVWLLSAIAAAWLSERKGYGEQVGLAFGLLLSVGRGADRAARPARADSRWKLQGAFGSGGKTVAEARAEREASSEDGS